MNSKKTFSDKPFEKYLKYFAKKHDPYLTIMEHIYFDQI